ncbi:ABC transporter ATP-binding protein [Humibacillus xanthopallidus]|uniref:Amino acid/amide ABC transporter ATP-binding protein 1 (HAAT family) n=1 Tax=Humibacillus xanthopallidus TaxID=412689 RepID=A0A543HVB3_9MICO|nr:ABC transporter ATP-binding protein [Humibacillus xanthopallidus]TQM62242.1 amino acid/amide ABC transporter ATP-binding protein 1 (HAAT family) [Humibacillus xanthopallidus]
MSATTRSTDPPEGPGTTGAPAPTRPAPAGDRALRLRDVTITFGGVTALDGVSFEVHPGRICGLIGPNGAGKTTLFNCITRIYVPSSGQILWGDTDLLRLRPHALAGAGIARTFQNLALFGAMSVFDNAMVGGTSVSRVGLTSGALGWPPARRRQQALRDRAWHLLDRLDLLDVAERPAAGLPFGTLKRVELARALMSQPALLLLDEPAGGLTHSEVKDLGSLITSLRDELGFAALLVEHHMGLVLGISDHVVALDFGRTIFEGSPSAVRDNPDVVRAYLGRAA